MPSATHKVQQMVLFFARESADDPSFGKTKLLKLLAFTDFLAFFTRGRSVTDARYCKLTFGPGPRELPTALMLLQTNDLIDLEAEGVHEYEQTRVTALGQPDLSVFDQEDIDLAREVLERFKDVGNKAMSDISHREFVGWNMVEEKRDIPTHTVYLSPVPPTDTDVRRGQELAAAHAW